MESELGNGVAAIAAYQTALEKYQKEIKPKDQSSSVRASDVIRRQLGSIYLSYGAVRRSLNALSGLSVSTTETELLRMQANSMLGDFKAALEAVDKAAQKAPSDMGDFMMPDTFERYRKGLRIYAKALADAPYTPIVAVAKVYAGTSAAKLGLRAGDLVLEFDGESEALDNRLVQALRHGSGHEGKKLVVLRDGETIALVTPSYLMGAEMVNVFRSHSAVSVRAVQPGSAAEQVGLRKFDVIWAVNSERVRSLLDIEDAKTKYKKLKLTIRRYGATDSDPAVGTSLRGFRRSSSGNGLMYEELTRTVANGALGVQLVPVRIPRMSSN